MARSLEDKIHSEESEDSLCLSIVLPCLNEEESIGAVIESAKEGIRSAGCAGEVIVVDNGSTDRSAAVASEHGARVIAETRRGYGSAYLAGLREARGKIIVMADSDGTYDVSRLEPFLAEFDNGNDMVIGSRFLGAIHKGAMPWAHRWIGNPVLTFILNRFFGVRVNDAHCGLRAMRRDAVPKLKLHTTGMEFASEMIVKASRARLKIAEVPIDYFPRTGESKLRTFRDGWRHLRFLLIYSPTYLFVVPGAALLLVGLVVMTPFLTGPQVLFGRLWGIHTMIAGATAILIGSQVLQLGLCARTYGVLYLEDRDPPLERLWTRVRLEHGLVIGFLLLVAGGAMLLLILIDWASRDFGELAKGYEAVAGMTLLGLGVQIISTSFFLSILGLRPSNEKRAR